MYDNTYMFEIVFEENVEKEMAAVRPFEGRRILDAILEQLQHEPDVPTRNRKMLRGAKPPFTALLPTWELRVGEYRVFYDVDRKEKKVILRSVRRKLPHKTTEEIS